MTETPKPRNSTVSIVVGLVLVAVFGFAAFDTYTSSRPTKGAFTDAQYQAAIRCPTDDEERRQAALESRSDPKEDSRVMTCAQLADFEAEQEVPEVEAAPTLLDSDYLAADIVAKNSNRGITSATCIEASYERQFICNLQYYAGMTTDISVLVSVDGEKWTQLH